MSNPTPDSPHRYELLERIAGGGMGEVFLAKAYGAHGFEKSLAIKRILPRLAADAKFEKRFIAEAKLAVTLAHGNIVQVFDFGHLGGSLYIAMEYIDGLDIAAVLEAFTKEAREVPLAAGLHIGIEMCRGLQFAHRRGVVHRDISPQNVLLSRAGEVKIADFGIARAVDRTSALFQTGAIVGKWNYMSPEQTRGEPVDARSDLFATGVVLYEMLAGQRLFDAKSLDAAIQQIQTKPIPRISAVRPDVPADVDAVLARALERDRDRRYDDANALQRALVEVCHDQRILPTPDDVVGLVEPLLGSDAAEALDDRLAAEMDRVGVAPREGRRVTVQAMPGHPAPAGRAKLKETMTFVRLGSDADGGTKWADGTEIAAASASQTMNVVPLGKARSRAGYVAAAAVVLIGAVTAVVIASGGSDEAKVKPVAPAAAAPADAAPAAELPVASDAAAPIAMTTLVVNTKPEGATVELDGEPLGRTPLDTQLPADGAEHSLVVKKPGHATVKTRVTLEPGGRAVVDRELAKKIKRGTIDLHVEPWANVYFRGRKVAEAPVRGLKLPVGKHRLKLVNPVSKRSKTITVTVPRSKPYRVQLPPPK